MNQKLKWKRPGSKGIRRTSEKQQTVVLILVRGILGGSLVALLLFAAGALAFSRLPIPGALARPTACLISGAGAMVSGILLARGFGHQRLLCGLGSGVFYSLCITGASAIQGEFQMGQREIALICMLVLAGMLGGAVTAVRASGKRGH